MAYNTMLPYAIVARVVLLWHPIPCYPRPWSYHGIQYHATLRHIRYDGVAMAYGAPSHACYGDVACVALRGVRSEKVAAKTIPTREI